MSILNAVPVFILILVRISCFLATMPIFSYRTVPATVRIGLAVSLSLLVDVVLFKDQTLATGGTFVLLVLKEALIGLTMGFAAGILTYGVQFAGSLIDLQMGFALANVISPDNGSTAPLSGQLLFTLQMMFFLGVDAHHMLISGLLQSFTLFPLNRLAVQIASGQTVEFVTKLTAQLFIIGLQLAIPLVGCLFLTDVAIGIVARTVPQVNVFVVGLPLKIMVGFVILIILFPAILVLFRVIFDSMTDAFGTFMQLLEAP
ncbi:MAG: flagellar type III secretion system protein FliR [Sporolactobacillus sp.]|nr:flagellar type III secretion system protein FliR [Sporolactobacillus sp.]